MFVLAQDYGNPTSRERRKAKTFRFGFFKEGKASIRTQIVRIACGLVLAFAGVLLPSAATAQNAAPSPDLMAGLPWEYGVFVNGGVGTGNRAD